MLHRRTFLSALTAAPLTLPAVARATPDLTSRINELEKASGGRLGVAVLDTHDGRRFAWRGDQRFRMCSTFKTPLAAAILRRVDQGREQLDRRVSYGRDVLIAHSPAVEKHLGQGMTLGALCEATITLSDNAAANLLLDALGGPSALTRFLRAIGDETTRCDRREPELNFGAPDDPRDTTTPVAIVETWRTLLLDDALTPTSRRQLADWVIANRTGDRRLRAGLPRGWRIGDKTGSDGRAITNDVAIAWPPGRKPLLLAVFHDQGSPDDAVRNAVLADVARAVVASGFGA